MAANVAETVWYNEDSLTPLTVSKPAAFASGEILVAIIESHGGLLSDLTAPSGWTEQGNWSGNTRAKVFSHVWSGGDPSTWDFPYNSTADVCLGLFRISGADTAPTIVVTSSVIEPVTSSMDSPTVTPTGTNDLLICTIGNTCGGTALTETDPSGMTDLSQTQTGLNMAMAAASQQLSSGSATGVRTWTSVSPTTSQSGGAFSVAIKSAPPATSTITAPEQALPLDLLLQLLGEQQAQYFGTPDIIPIPFTGGRSRLRPPFPQALRRKTPPPVPAQAAPPPPARVRKQFPPRPRPARNAFVPPAQVVVAPPSWVPSVTRLIRRAARLTTPRRSFIPPPQDTPPNIREARRQLVPRLRVPRSGFIPADQQTPPPAGRARKQQAPRLRTPRSAFVPPPQAAPAPPLWTPSVARILRRIARLPQRHTPPVVPAQVVVTAPTYVPMSARIRLRAARLLRPRNTAPIPLQTAPPPPSPTRRPVPQMRTTRRPRPVVPPQVILINPAWVPRKPPRRQLAAWAKHRTTSPAWMVIGQPPTTPPPRYGLDSGTGAANVFDGRATGQSTDQTGRSTGDLAAPTRSGSTDGTATTTGAIT